MSFVKDERERESRKKNSTLRFNKNKYEKYYIIKKMKEFYHRKHDRYPSFESLYNEHGWTKRAINDRIRNEEDKSSETSISFWHNKIKDLQRELILDRVVENDSPQCLLFIAKQVHKLDQEENSDVDNKSASDIDIKKAIMYRDLQIFFQLAKKPMIDEEKKFVHLEGGRAGGKSEQVARYIILKALSRETQGTILCGREIQKSTDTSVKPLLERVIESYNLNQYFHITKKEILCLINNVRIVFMGLKEACSDNSDTLKSTDLLFLAWVEEAQSVSEQSLDKLLPTVARVDNYQIIFTYNRNRQQTIVYDYFFNDNIPPERTELTQHININYWDNKFNSDELIALAELDKVSNRKKYDYIWGGLPQTEFDGALWSYDDIKQLIINLPYDKHNYKRRIVATDPATSHKDFNNEYGITVLGITHEGYVHLLADYSGHFTASEYAREVVRAYHTYDCESIVYEENQGGDHIANTILGESKSVRLIPVRANESKYLRALPVANLCNQGKIYFTKSFPQIENQMLLLTIQGYQGVTGESPDRLDSFVWGCYELLQLEQQNSIDVYFKKGWVKTEDTINQERFRYVNTIAYYSVKQSKTVCIKFDYINIRKTYDYLPHIIIRDIIVDETSNIVNTTEPILHNVNTILVNTEDEVIDFSNINIPVDKLIIEDKLSLVELSAKTIQAVQNNFIYIPKDNKEIENLLIDNMFQYVPEDMKENIVLEGILEIVYNENN